ncbi:MAG: hypothetical protein WCL18_02610 [bacterium]
MTGAAWIVQPKALIFIGVPSAFPARNSITLLGVYAASHQSLARFPLSVFALEVQVLSAYLSPATVNLFSQPGILFAVSDRIFHIKEIIHGLITSFCNVWPVF